MNILITGGAGFIGYHLCKKKLEEGNKVICIDNLNSGQSDNINHLIKYEHFSFINHNIISVHCASMRSNFNIGRSSISKFEIQMTNVSVKNSYY